MEWTPLSPILFAKLLGESGGSVTPASIVTATGQMTEQQATDTRTNLGALGTGDLGTVFTYKGAVATIADLPASGNSVGDVWFVESELANFVWLVDEINPGGFWDEFGQPIDLSAYQLKPVQNAPAGTTPSITPAANNIYTCGELTSLTITNPTSTGMYVIEFDSGSTPTTTTIQPGIHGLSDPEDNFAAKANTHYEINVRNNWALIGSWAVSSS